MTQCDRVIVRPAQSHDLVAMGQLSRLKRQAYEAQQPVFWRSAGPEGDRAQRTWWDTCLKNPRFAAWVAVSHDQGSMVGFVMAQLIEAPPVYNPGGYTVMVDDFCVADDADWDSVGGTLCSTAMVWGRQHGAVQMVVGAHDGCKRSMLAQQSLCVASEWWVWGPIWVSRFHSRHGVGFKK